MSPGRILIVDDEIELMHALCGSLNGPQYQVHGVTTAVEALDMLKIRDFDLMLIDLTLPEMDGVQLLRLALAINPSLIGIMMTSQATVAAAVEALKVEAFDYILKPFKLSAILPVLARAMEMRVLRRESVRLQEYLEEFTSKSSRQQLIGSGPALQKVRHTIETVSTTNAPVLIHGPSGTGKKFVARLLHRSGLRKDRPLLTIHCAMPEAQLEVELFGQANQKRGLFEIAEGGTLFIEEMASMPLGMQAKLMHLLETGHYRRAGSHLECRADVRLIASTSKSLDEEQKAGRFREDLFCRLNIFAMALPPLKERREDIPELVEHFLAGRHRIDPEALAALVDYDWPGNIRELVHVIELARIRARDSRITLGDLPLAASR